MEAAWDRHAEQVASALSNDQIVLERLAERCGMNAFEWDTVLVEPAAEGHISANFQYNPP